MELGELLDEQGLHLDVPATPRHLERITESHVRRAAIEEELGDRELVFANGKGEWSAILVVRADQRWIFLDQPPH